MLGSIVVTVAAYLAVPTIAQIAPPVYPAGTESYERTANPAGSEYAPITNPRPAAFWDLNCDVADKTCPGQTQVVADRLNEKEPSLAPYPDGPADWLHVDYAGPRSNATGLLTSAPDAIDKAVRFPGRNKSCLLGKDFTSSLDVCLSNPGACEIEDSSVTPLRRGLSFSFWVILPQEFMREPRYLIDTGADEKGSAGVAVYFIGSTDGVKFSHQLTFLVSTGIKYWKVVVNGMTRPYAWNNIGVRWSGDLHTSANGDVPYGLRVYVNGTQVAAKYWETTNTGAASSVPGLADVRLAVGCQLDGGRPFLGIIDNLAFWYWYLPDAHTVFFDGDLTFIKPAGTTDILDENSTVPTGTIMTGGFVPWQYMEEQMRKAALAASDQDYVDDTTPASEGDCLVGDTSTWGDGGDDNKPHPVDCADTRIELQAALELDEEYSGHELVKAIVRTVNKAGPTGLSESDVDYIWNVAFNAAWQKLGKRITMDTQVTGLTYANIMVAMSKMQEQMYDSLWDKTITTDQKAGLITYMKMLDEFLLLLADKFILIGNTPAIIQSANNHSVGIAIKVRQKDVTRAIVFPDYALLIRLGNDTEPYYNFPLKRKEHWGVTTDFIRLPKEAMEGSYSDTTTEIRLTAKLFNRMAEHMPGHIFSGVQGVDGATFQLNSRVISMSMRPEPDTPDALATHPVEYVVQHIKKQEDAPYKKGAVLCVYWKHAMKCPYALYKSATRFSNESYGGAWDTLGCTLDATNDTHSVCKCTHLTDFAVLLEDYTPAGRMPDAMYMICYVLYVISILLLLGFMFFVLYAELVLFSLALARYNRLHYEVHIVHWNCALALVLALSFYLATLAAKHDRLWCMVISVFVHYSYTAAYLWLTFCAHYVFRAITGAKLGGRILTWYSYLGWGGPAVLVTVLLLIDVSRYGIGDRCLGAHNDYFLWMYIALFLIFCFVGHMGFAFLERCTCPLVIIAVINLPRSIIKDPIDRADITWSLWGLAIIWPFIFLVWIWAIFIYLIPLGVQFIDFLFELFNSLHGILFVIVFGALVPSARLTIMTCGRGGGRDERRDKVRHKVFVPYLNTDGGNAKF